MNGLVMRVYLILAIVVVSSGCSCLAFQPVSFASRRSLSLSASGKGFGSVPPPAEPKKPSPKKSADEAPPSSVSQTTPTTSSSSPPSSKPSDFRGKQAVEALRRERVEQRDRDLRRLRELRDIDASLQEDPGAAAIPEKVANRMGARMLPFVGIPLFGSLASFVAFWYLATYRDMEFQPALVATTTVVFLAVGLVGITYSIFSTSWDEDREGSLLGFDEAKRNLDNVKEGLGRSKENQLTRERMARLSDQEINSAMAKLDRQDPQNQNKSD